VKNMPTYASVAIIPTDTKILIYGKEEIKKIKLRLYALYQYDGLVDTGNLISKINSMTDNYGESHKVINDQ